MDELVQFVGAIYPEHYGFFLLSLRISWLSSISLLFLSSLFFMLYSLVLSGQ